MAFRWVVALTVAWAMLAQAPQIMAGDEGPELPKGIKDLEIGALWYLSYQYGEDNSEGGPGEYNLFAVKRGYININKTMTPWLEARITPDVHQDSAGDMKVRLKYAYAKFKFPTKGAIYEPWLEFGQAHMPWLDFEEHINFYRLQDKMFAERNGNFNSADLGATFGALLGGEVDKEYQKSVNNKYPGRYGSFAVGIYNGGGYHAVEKNENKALEGRLTVRPAPDNLPGLQVSYFGIYGEGNVQHATATSPDTTEMSAPDWRVNLAQISYEHQYVTLTGTVIMATGNQKGGFDKVTGKAVDHGGYSVFGEFKIPEKKSSIIARWDYYDPNKDHDDDENNRVIVGYAYHLPMHSMVLLDLEHVSFADDSRDADWRLQTTVQIHYP
jgi:hypothetical protein